MRIALGPGRFLSSEAACCPQRNGNPGVHDIQGDELRLLQQLKRSSQSAFVFTSERDGGNCPLSRFTVNDIVERAGKLAKLPFKCHTHMLRQAKGYTLAEKRHDTIEIQDYLGHKNIAHTMLPTQLSSKRMKPLSGDEVVEKVHQGKRHGTAFDTSRQLCYGLPELSAIVVL